MDAEPAGPLYACAACGGEREVPQFHRGALWCPCGSPRPMEPALLSAESQQLLSQALASEPGGLWQCAPSGVTGTAEAAWHALLGAGTAADGEFGGELVRAATAPEVTLDSVAALMRAYEDARAAASARWAACMAEVRVAFSPQAEPFPLPWSLPGADVLGDIRGVMRAMEAGTHVTIPHTDYAGRISPAVSTAPSEWWEVTGDAMRWSPDYTEPE